MDPLTMLAIGAGLGLMKSQFVDRPKEDRQRRLAAKTQELSPWTGLAAKDIQEADPFGSALSFGTTGAQLGMGMQQADMNNKLAQKLADSYSVPQISYHTNSPRFSLMPEAYSYNPYGAMRGW